MTLVAILWSLCGIVSLSRHDAKRRRTLGYPPAPSTGDGRIVWAWVGVPGALLMISGNWSGFVLWLAALTTLGWAWVTIPDHKVDAAIDALLRRLVKDRAGKK